VNYFSSKKFSFTANSFLKNLIILHSLFAIVCVLLDPILIQLKLHSPQFLFSLSTWGVKKFFIWQYLTYFFVAPFTQVNLSLVFYTVFNMYFLWSVGMALIERKGIKDFLNLYFVGGIFAGVACSMFLMLTKTSALICGINAPLYSLLTAWMILMPEMQILLFFTIPIRIKWLITGVLGVNLLIDLSNGNLTTFVLYFCAIAFGYLYSILSWKTHSPFQFLFPFEKGLIHLFTKSDSHKRKGFSAASEKKIYDFKTGLPVQAEKEDLFADKCLSKIEKNGRSSLSFIEKWKLKKISKKFRNSSIE